MYNVHRLKWNNGVSLFCSSLNFYCIEWNVRTDQDDSIFLRKSYYLYSYMKCLAVEIKSRRYFSANKNCVIQRRLCSQYYVRTTLFIVNLVYTCIVLHSLHFEEIAQQIALILMRYRMFPLCFEYQVIVYLCSLCIVVFTVQFVHIYVNYSTFSCIDILWYLAELLTTREFMSYSLRAYLSLKFQQLKTLTNSTIIALTRLML